MAEKKKSLGKEVEDTMACSAFAEAGEPCPIDPEADKNAPDSGPKKSIGQSVEEAMACAAFAEQGEPCQIDAGEKSGDEDSKSSKKPATGESAD